MHDNERDKWNVLYDRYEKYNFTFYVFIHPVSPHRYCITFSSPIFPKYFRPNIFNVFFASDWTFPGLLVYFKFLKCLPTEVSHP